VRLLLYAKDLDVEIVEPSGFHGDPSGKGDYLGVNPIGQVPALVLDDGRVLPESEVICEYLERRRAPRSRSRWRGREAQGRRIGSRPSHAAASSRIRAKNSPFGPLISESSSTVPGWSSASK